MLPKIEIIRTRGKFRGFKNPRGFVIHWTLSVHGVFLGLALCYSHFL